MKHDEQEVFAGDAGTCVADARGDAAVAPNMMSALRHVAGLLGMSPETLRLWQRRVEVDAGVKPGLTTEAAAEIKRLQKENAEFRKANVILKAASVLFANELDRARLR